MNLKGLTQASKEVAKTEAGEIIVDEINEFLDRSSSPVKGGKFKRFKETGGLSELFEDGDMRSQITFESGAGDSIEVGIFDDAPTVERLKAFNHNTGDTVPERRFIASPNQKFKASIMDKVERNIESIRIDQESEGVSTDIDDLFGDESLDRIIGDILGEI